MATLKEKSETNISSALILTARQDTCLSSVHCDYYSCYQLMLFYLDKAFGYNDSKRKREYDSYISSFGGKRPLGSHEYWINEFHKHLCGRKKNSTSNIINMNIRKLRENRMEADYKETDFAKADTDKLYETARNTIGLINQSFE